MKDGGPAFPALFDRIGEWRIHGGMTLRDWFAGQALAALPSPDAPDAAAVARDAYEIADAMLKAREAA